MHNAYHTLYCTSYCPALHCTLNFAQDTTICTLYTTHSSEHIQLDHCPVKTTVLCLIMCNSANKNRHQQGFKARLFSSRGFKCEIQSIIALNTIYTKQMLYSFRSVVNIKSTETTEKQGLLHTTGTEWICLSNCMDWQLI